MPDNKESRLGLYSGLFAVIMVVALAVMAFTALEPPPIHLAQNDLVSAEQTRLAVSGD